MKQDNEAMTPEELRQIIREEHGKLLDAIALMLEAAKPRKAKKPAEFVDAQEMVEAGVAMRHAAEWLAIRKSKSVPLTRTAWEQTQEEAQKAGLSIGDAIKASCANGWAGFKAKWLAQEKQRDERGEPSQKQAAVVTPSIEKTRQLLASQEMTEEERRASDEARKLVQDRLRLVIKRTA